MEKPEPPVLRLVGWLGNSRANLLDFPTDAYRVVVAVQIGKKIYVLHAFQKKSKKGIKTPQSDKDLIRKRYNAAVQAAKEEEKHERRN